MKILLVCVAGVILDIVFGDPVWLYHPVRLIGHLISFLERWLRKRVGQSQNALFMAGTLLWVAVAGTVTVTAFFLLYLAKKIHPTFGLGLEIFWCYQLLAAKSLRQESMKVYHKLKRHDLHGARRAISMIVGRDTEGLTSEEITKAAVETVAENTSDGVIAPLFYMLIGGAPLAFFYKAVNTMDSMIGYKNMKYLYFGRAAAKLDDVLNYIPARISALMMVCGAYLIGLNSSMAWSIYVRDRRNHASPNAAQTESVCAGALGVQLAGDTYYFGKLYEKPTIGDALRPIEPEDINRTCHLMYAASLLTLLIGCGIRYFFV